MSTPFYTVFSSLTMWIVTKDFPIYWENMPS